MTSGNVEEVRIESPCGPIGATVYRPTDVLGAVMIAPATGIRRRFYDRFAKYLQTLGFAVVTFDNRGIGDSCDGPVRDSAATLVSWGANDMSAVLRWMIDAFPGTTYQLVGHSAGGQLLGLMDDATVLRSFVAVASSSGSIRNMRGLFGLKARFFLQGVLPITTRIFGCGRSDLAGMGEPLPPGVARQWTRWCSGAGYVDVAIQEDGLPHQYDTLTMPSLWVHAIDDGIANAANVADMLRVHPSLPAEVRCLNPADHGLERIDHMGLFRHEGLWPPIGDWLRRHAST